MTDLLTVEQLSVFDRQTRQPIVDCASFAVAAGRTLGVVGELGLWQDADGDGDCRTAAEQHDGERPRTSRRYRDGGRRSGLTRDLRTASIGVVFQNPSTALNPRLTVGAQIEEALSPPLRRDRAAAAQACLELLEEVGAPQPYRKLTAYPHELSGGIAQRVVIAMALARSPKLLIADEPTTALDVTIQAQILDLIAELQAKHQFAVLLITHDMGVISDRTGEVVVMARGRVIEGGRTRDLFCFAKTPEAKALLRASQLAFADEDSAAAARAPLLAVTELRKTFRKGPTALAGVDLEICVEQAVGIVGESGSGKTTLARIIAGLETQDSGEVAFDGAKRPTGRRNGAIQYVFQDPYSSLDPRMAILHTVCEPLLARGDDIGMAREAAGALLEEVGLDRSLWLKPPTSLSGGQRQRVGIARAVATGPRLLIADEPVAALDSAVRERVLALLRSLQVTRRMSLLLISHDLAVVARICTHVIVMRGGAIVESGPTRRIFETPQQAYTQQLLRAIPGRSLEANPRAREAGAERESIFTVEK